MSNVKDRSAKCKHLAQQLYNEVGELFTAMTEETKKNNVKDLTEFQFVKNIMLIDSVVKPLSKQIEEVYFVLTMIAIGIPGFLEQIKQDLKVETECDCQECKGAVDSVMKRVEEITKSLKEPGRDPSKGN